MSTANSDVRSTCYVLRRTNYGEADRILNLITPEGRMITAAGVDLDDFYAEYKRHTHGCPHGGNTSTPS